MQVLEGGAKKCKFHSIRMPQGVHRMVKKLSMALLWHKKRLYQLVIQPGLTLDSGCVLIVPSCGCTPAWLSNCHVLLHVAHHACELTELILCECAS